MQAERTSLNGANIKGLHVGIGEMSVVNLYRKLHLPKCKAHYIK